MNSLHIFGIFLKNVYLIRRSWHRILGLFYWMTVELFFWGFITIWIKKIAAPDIGIDFVLVLITALIFWHLFSRAQQSLSVSFLEDVWSRNMMNIFASPITPKELIVSLITLGFLQGLLAFIYITILASLLYALDIFTIGYYIIPFFLNVLIFGWAIGIFVVGLVIRFGPSVEIFAWSIPFLFLPLSAVYYPASILPLVVQKIAFFTPTMHLFEGMRQVLLDHTFPFWHAMLATGLNLFYFAGGLLFFYWMLRLALKRGLIARLLTE